MITVYTLAYNEELLIQFMINHYRSRFPNCHIVIYDNSSTDKTVEIAKANNCEVRYYNSGNTLNDGLHMRMKNSSWKDAKTDWVLVCDMDELLDITEEELTNEASLGTTIIKPEAWTMINMFDNYDLDHIDHGQRDPGYDKCVLFNKKHINEINYGAGCHSCRPIGIVKFADKKYIMHHYRDLNPDHLVNKSKITTQRLSEDNKRHGWGIQCLRSEEELRKDFQRIRSIAVIAPERRKIMSSLKNKVPLTIYTVTYNEELIIPLMIDHYRSRFSDCHIVVYDNQSTDKTVEIAKANNCEIRHYDSKGLVDDLMLWQTKNSCWKDAKTDWVLVCDTDELLDIDEKQLAYEESIGTTKIKSECWHMVNMKDNLDVKSITYGCRNVFDTVYDKDLLFNKKFVKEIGYEGAGCHSSRSTGLVKNSKPYKMYHYKYVNPDVFVAKQATSAKRLSDLNRKNNWGTQCLRDEANLRGEFQQARDAAVKVFGLMPHFYENIQGWFNYHDLYTDVVKKLPNKSHVVEVGAWKGRSTACLAVEIINSDKKIKLDVVDSWIGDLDDPTSYHTDEEFMSYNRNILELFKKNLSPVNGKIDLTPLQMASVDASKLYEDSSLDFVFLDANHAYEHVKNDIDSWLLKIKKGGMIAGHDYNPNSFPGVIKAVNEFFPNKFNIIGECWFVQL